MAFPNLHALKIRMLSIPDLDHVPFDWLSSGKHWIVTYAFLCGEHVKVGKTRNLKSRWSGLRVANPTEFRLLGAVEGDRERWAHRELERAGWPRVSGEWFQDAWIYEHVWEDAVHLRDVLYELGLCWRVTVGTLVEAFLNDGPDTADQAGKR